MKYTRKSTLLLFSLSLLAATPLFADETVAPPAGRKELRLEGLNANSTEEEVRNAIKKAGIEPTDHMVQQVMAQLKGQAKPAAQPEVGRQELRLEGLTPNSTEEEVRNAIKKSGVEPTDHMIQQVMAQLKGQAKPAAGGIPLAFDGTESREQVREKIKQAHGKVPSDEEVESVYQKLQQAKINQSSVSLGNLSFEVPEGAHRMPFTLSETGSPQFLLDAEVNDHKVKFLLDSGADSGVLNQNKIAELGITSESTGATAVGIQGATKIHVANVSSLKLGVATASKIKMKALSLPPNATFHGIAGFDFLSDVNAVINFRTREVIYCKEKAIDLQQLVKNPESWESLSLIDGTVVEAMVGDKKLNFQIDTGASISLLDADVAKELGLKLYENNQAMRGVGGANMKPSAGFVDSLKLGKTELPNFGFNVLPLNHLQKANKVKKDGILGADALFAMKPLMDFGNKKIHILPGKYGCNLFQQSGRPLGSDLEKFKLELDKGTFVGAIEILDKKLYNKGKQPKGTPQGTRAIALKAKVLQVFNGSQELKDKVMTLHYYIDESPTLEEDFAFGLSRSKNRFLIGLPQEASKRLNFLEDVYYPGQVTATTMVDNMEALGKKFE